MKRIESLKKLIISELPLVGLFLYTGAYAYFWMTEYYPYLRLHRGLNYYFKGHILMFLVYFVLLYFFASTYGGLKIGYLKPIDVYFSQFFSLAGVNVISYLQISLMQNWLADAKPIVAVMLIQVLLSAAWVYVCNMLYRKVFPPREILLVHGERPIDDIVAKFDSRKDKYRINRCMNISEGTDKIREEILAGYG
ncbi:MAG: sugar transferase, partial [Lachnospiraceae bacterium]|nr:sugar transferase [Lachnospiraceae bacterium]